MIYWLPNHSLTLDNIDDIDWWLSNTHTERAIFQGRIKLGKDKMLTTIVMTLLAIYLSIQLAVMVASGVFSYKFFKSLTDEKND